MGQKLRKLTDRAGGKAYSSYGLGIGEFFELSGETWVEIQSDDDWHDHPKAYVDDADAARAVARAGNGIAMWFDEETGDLYPIAQGSTPDEKDWLLNHKGGVICLVQEKVARKAIPWYEDV